MARKPSAKVVLNRAALLSLGQHVADGMSEAGRTVIETARPPDSPYMPYPTGEGLPRQGGTLTYVHGQKVAGWSLRGVQPKKPRSVDVRAGLVCVVGFGFPGRFAETGTVHSRPQPFLSPARDQVAPHIPEIIGRWTRPIVNRSR